MVVEGSESGPRGRADGPEDRPLSERCITYGAPRTGTGYNSYVQLIQSPETVVILQEMIHDARLVPMNGTPHLPKGVRQLHGDPRGRWEGDTLVVESTNFIGGFNGSTPDVKLTERYTRVSQDYINWEITVDDPAHLGAAVDDDDPAEADRRSDLRIRVPRGQPLDDRHPRRRARRRSQGGRRGLQNRITVGLRRTS